MNKTLEQSIVVSIAILMLVDFIGFVTVTGVRARYTIEEVRFRQPDEIEVNPEGHDWITNVATFVWTPRDPSMSVVVTVRCYFEYRFDSPDPTVWEWEGDFISGLTYGMRINEIDLSCHETIWTSASNQTEWEQKALEWRQVLYEPIGQSIVIKPAQNNYTFTFGTSYNYLPSPMTFTPQRSIDAPTYVRNINLVIVVIDGIA